MNDRRRAGATPALIGYLALSFWLFGSRRSWFTHHVAASGDPVQSMWFLHWWPFAIARGIDPFWTYYVWAPHGFDLAWATAMPVLALLGAPITLLFGPAVTYNLLTVCNPGLAAWAAFLLSRAITRDDAAALVGGLLFGFSSYEIGQTLGHLNLDTIVLVPLMVLLAVRRVTGQLSRRWFIGLTSVGMALEFGISIEIFATMCVFGGLAWAAFMAFGRTSDRQALWRLAVELVAAIALTMIIVSPFLYFLWLGADTVPKTINDVVSNSADPISFIVPDRQTWLGHRPAAPSWPGFWKTPRKTARISAYR